MGLCGSNMSPDERKMLQEHMNNETELRQALQKERHVVKILILGTGESGKSTVFKQMQILYLGGFKHDQRMNFRNVIRKNLLDSMVGIIQACDKKFGYEFETDDERRAAKMLEGLFSVEDSQAKTLGNCIDYLWKHSKAVAKAFKRRNEYYIVDSADYFFDKTPKIMSSDYVPDDEDILRARLRTSGITEQTFVIGNVGYHFVDVGGQRNEQKKWMHCFANVQMLMFITAISEYDQVLFEDDSVNRMHESLNVFKRLLTSKEFDGKPVILFFNKRDLLEEKIKRKIDPSVCFPDYKEGCDAEKAMHFIKEKFAENVAHGRPTYCHYVTAIDTNNLERVWIACKDVILQHSMRDAGLV